MCPSAQAYGELFGASTVLPLSPPLTRAFRAIRLALLILLVVVAQAASLGSPSATAGLERLAIQARSLLRRATRALVKHCEMGVVEMGFLGNSFSISKNFCVPETIRRTNATFVVTQGIRELRLYRRVPMMRARRLEQCHSVVSQSVVVADGSSNASGRRYVIYSCLVDDAI